ncbi:MAG: Holliday junction branch migration DNA helicase RuvB [Candidatus Brocadiaceae bacterium]|nr:Holliday junction branch migration DNA helicase RuvB [Candidatus Brocadiaceae bacterium]
MNEQDIYSGLPQDDEQTIESVLRPASFADFVGRPGTVDNLRTWIEAARMRAEPLDHILFCGPPGLGKTTLAYIIANELGVSLRSTSGPALSKPRDLVGLLTGLRRGDVLFIDEIHRLDVRVEEYLYTAMEDFFITIIIDPGPHGRSIRLDLRPFTLIGATTREGLLAPPLRSRFQISERLDFYTTDELMEVAAKSARILGIGLQPQAARRIAECSRGTPRITNRFLRRIRDVAQAAGSGVITPQIAEDGLRRLGVDDRGLAEMDRRILALLARSSGRPVGLKTIAAVVGEQEDTIEDVYEPFLIRQGLLERTARGRAITPAGLEACGADGPGPEGQASLF